ncbi:MAG: response regulator [Nitrospirae bacterium]|nr:response regulator [Nitrospirota bacterium]
MAEAVAHRPKLRFKPTDETRLSSVSDPANVSSHMAKKPYTVVVAEDDPVSAKILLNELQKAGFKVQVFPNGGEAIQAIKQSPPDVAILDLMMPKLHGFEVCRMIKTDAALKSVKVMILTARAYKPDQDKAMELGADGFVLKPFAPNEIIEKIRKLAGG